MYVLSTPIRAYRTPVFSRSTCPHSQLQQQPLIERKSMAGTRKRETCTKQQKENNYWKKILINRLVAIAQKTRFWNREVCLHTYNNLLYINTKHITLKYHFRYLEKKNTR